MFYDFRDFYCFRLRFSVILVSKSGVTEGAKMMIPGDTVFTFTQNCELYDTIAKTCYLLGPHLIGLTVFSYFRDEFVETLHYRVYFIPFYVKCPP